MQDGQDRQQAGSPGSAPAHVALALGFLVWKELSIQSWLPLFCGMCSRQFPDSPGSLTEMWGGDSARVGLLCT